MRKAGRPTTPAQLARPGRRGRPSTRRRLRLSRLTRGLVALPICSRRGQVLRRLHTPYRRVRVGGANPAQVGASRRDLLHQGYRQPHHQDWLFQEAAEGDWGCCKPPSPYKLLLLGTVPGTPDDERFPTTVSLPPTGCKANRFKGEIIEEVLTIIAQPQGEHGDTENDDGKSYRQPARGQQRHVGQGYRASLRQPHSGG